MPTISISPTDRLFVLTGAGISAESGLPTFRASDGLWAGHRIEDVCTPEALHRNPALVWEFYSARRASAQQAQPNPAHIALAQLESRLGDRFFLCTQNVDDLHERAGSTRLVHMHGELRQVPAARRNAAAHPSKTTRTPVYPMLADVGHCGTAEPPSALTSSSSARFLSSWIAFSKRSTAPHSCSSLALRVPSIPPQTSFTGPADPERAPSTSAPSRRSTPSPSLTWSKAPPAKSCPPSSPWTKLSDEHKI